MRILYVSQYYPPEMGAPAARVSELAQHWARAGNAVTVLTAFPNQPGGKVLDGYRRKIWRLVTTEKMNGVSVVRTWLVPLPNRSSWQRMVNYTSFFLSACISGLFLDKSEVVIGSSPQLLAGLAGWVIAKARKSAFILEVRDLWPESLAAVGAGGEASMTYRLLRRVADFLYRECDRIVVVSHPLKSELEERSRISPQKVVVIENGVDTKFFAPVVDPLAAKADLGLKGKWVVGYIGTIGLAHGIKTLVEAAALFERSHPDVKFLVVGDGAERLRLLSLIAEQRLNNVEVLPSQDREQVPRIISACDVCVVLLLKAELFKAALPTKTMEFMACGRAVVAASDGLLSRIIEEGGCGIVVEPQSAPELADALLQLRSNPNLCTNMGQNGRKYASEKFERSHTAERYAVLLQSVAAEHVP